MTNYVTYVSYYPGGWIDSPSTATPIIAAALQNLETGMNVLYGSVGYGGTFGNASDGPVILDGVTNYAGFSSRAGSVYTLTRDVQATTFTINNGVTLKPANYRIFCQGAFTNNGIVTAAGNNAAGQIAGSGQPWASLAGGRAGGGGGAGVNGAGGTGLLTAFGGTGGAGGAGTSGAAGPGGTVTVPLATVLANILITPYPMLAGQGAWNGAAVLMQTGSGGGGGGADSGGTSGGGGGGFAVIFAWSITNNGTITVAGGNGANGTGGNAGGGGGGGGGLIYGCSLTAWTPGTLTTAGGNPGNGSGTGSPGTGGNAGGSLNLVLQ